MVYINLLLAIFGDDGAYFVVDEHRRHRPAGIGRFAASRGGHLRDDPAEGRLLTVGYVESSLLEVAALEQGAILQNLGLMTQALGLGGFPHYAAHSIAWLEALGFRTQDLPLSRTIGAGRTTATLFRLLRKDTRVSTAVGLQRGDDVLIKPFCPPYYRNMEDAVLAFVDYKFGPGRGTFRDGGEATAWRDGATVQAGVPPYSDRAVAATVAYCEYVYERYGRFPSNGGPFRTILAYQAHHLEPEFYDRFYRPEALTATQRAHPEHPHE